MELSAQLPAELLTAALPGGCAPPESLRPPDGAEPAATFDALLLELAGTAMPSGDALPAGGSGLPSEPRASPSADAPADTPVDALAASELLALVVPQPQPQLQLPPAELPAPVADSSAPLPSVTQAPGSAQEVVAKAQQLRAALGQAAAQSNVGPPGDAVAEITDLAAGAAAVPDDRPAVAASDSAASTAQPTTVVAASDRAAAAMLAAQSAEAAEAAAPVARAAGGPRPSKEPRAAGTPTPPPADAPRTSATPLSQRFDLGSVAGTGDSPAGSPQTARAAEPLQIVVTPGAAAAASPDPQSLPPAHSPALSVLHAATSPDASPPTGTAPSAQQGSVDTTAARWHDALASRVQWLVDHDVGEARIKLNPPELGALDVKISLHDDKTFVQLTAHNAAARDELSQSLPRLRELLSANGLELGGATVSGGREQGAGRYPGAEPAAPPVELAADPEPAARARAGTSGAASSRIDVFA